jgi:hypothetical protein
LDLTAHTNLFSCLFLSALVGSKPPNIDTPPTGFLGLTGSSGTSGGLVENKLSSTSSLAHTNLSPIRHGFAPSFVNYKKGCTQLATASDKVYQLLAHGWWFAPGTLASSTTGTRTILKTFTSPQKEEDLFLQFP